jgi:hypothetical protein
MTLLTPIYPWHDSGLLERREGVPDRVRGVLLAECIPE